MARRFADFLAQLRGRGRDPDRERLLAILELNKALATEEDHERVVVRILDAAIALFGAERGFLLVTADQGAARAAFARTLDRESLHNPDAKFSRSVVRKVLESGEAVLSRDALEDEGLSPAASIADLKLRSVLCVPLRVGEATLGCLYLDHRFQASTFREEDRAWLSAFADQAAIALHHSRLMAENKAIRGDLERHNRRLEELVHQKEVELGRLKESLPDRKERARLAERFPELVGRSAAMAEVLLLVERVAGGLYPVLVTGESGSGKELVARAIHRIGPRAEKPFVAVNCAALSGALLESELFGHVKGAFTGAIADHPGLARMAHGGTLFLDEFTEMDPSLQARLLRFLEDGVVRPVGGKEGSRVDARILAATNRDPVEAVRHKRLREDLYFRLHVVEIRVPSLAQRREDVPVLAAHFLREAAAARGAAVPWEIAPEALARLVARPWPGNVRELRNEVIRLDALCPGPRITTALLHQPAAGLPLQGTLAEIERRAVLDAIASAGGNKAEAARRLGISRRSLYRFLGP